MSFHGGLPGVLFCHVALRAPHRAAVLAGDGFHRAAGAAGLGAGRMGNFINAELPGRAADPSLPWAMVFPHVDQIPRHPSQLYQFLAEGVVLFVLVWLFSAQVAPGRSRRRHVRARLRRTALHHRILPRTGQLSRLPLLGLTMGQWLCVPLMAIGVWLLVRRRPPDDNAWHRATLLALVRY